MKRENRIRQVLIVAMALLLLVGTVPMEVGAASRAKKYTVKISNANSQTVLKAGKKLKLKSTAKASNGKRAKVYYKSSNKKILTVTKKGGVVKAKKKGKAKITAYVKIKGKIRGRKTITIKVGKPVTSLDISGDKYLRVGQKTQLNAKISPAKATNKKVVWESSNPNIVSVDSKGIISSKGNGQAKITVKAVDGSGKKSQ